MTSIFIDEETGSSKQESYQRTDLDLKELKFKS